MRKVCFVLFIFSALYPANARVLVDSLRPYRLNLIVVEDETNLDSIKIFGRSYQNNRLLLFQTDVEKYQNRIDCYIYIDEDIHSVEVLLNTDKVNQLAFFYTVEINPYKIGIYNPGNFPLPDAHGYYTVLSPEDLNAGDIYICSERCTEDTIVDFLTRGIHCFVPGEKTDRAFKPDPWRGSFVNINYSQPEIPAEFLLKNRQSLALYKVSYQTLVARLAFIGLISNYEEETLTFKGVRIEDAAETLGKETLKNIFGRLKKLILAGFSLTCVLLIAFIRKTKTLLIIIPSILLVFLIVSILIPDIERMFSLELNPDRIDREFISFQKFDLVSPQQAHSFRETLFRTVDFSDREMKLKLDVIYSFRKKIPLEPFFRALFTRFNQYVYIQLESEKYYVIFNNPLKVWSLYEP